MRRVEIMGRFPLGEALPWGLIEEVVRFRIRANWGR
jgi:hypothetical protein